MPSAIHKLIGSLAVATLLTLLLATLPGCGCGFDCNNGNNNDNRPALLTLGISDSLPEELKQVVIEVDSITLVRNSAENIVIDQFTIDELNLIDADTFQVDLLDYRGATSCAPSPTCNWTPPPTADSKSRSWAQT